ncbi:eukaryotic translation initiation factor 1a [Plasmodium yoelii yoelii]|uniref:Eukaryotic translation initiation factor 1a n=1 Tax=Plasmodium yoelii yoelii TaxID=73239 RepID=Q7RN51_PLAYO|nr:eukaryotic translation initiation factor 1a [Plasmodium yoelii yoelii]
MINFIFIHRGKMRKRVWINSGDIILVSLRDYQDSKADVIAKYTPDEARSLKAHGELPETAKINETDIFDDDGQHGVEFLDDESDEEGQGEMNNDRKLDVEDVGFIRAVFMIYSCSVHDLFVQCS